MGKKAQEEIVGFVLIIVLVAIVGVVFLGIILRGGEEAGLSESIKFEKLLHSIETYTTECRYKGDLGYNTITDLTKDCIENNRACENNSTACIVLNNDLSEILNKTILIGEDSPNKYYELKILLFENNQSDTKIEIHNGACSGRRVGAETTPIDTNNGNIITSLEVCYLPQD